MAARRVTGIALAAILAACDTAGGGMAQRELPKGTRIAAVFTEPVSSQGNKAGDQVTVRVTADVSDSAGHVVIPAGSTIGLTIASIAAAPNKSAEGTLTFDVGDVTINGESHGIDAEVVRFDHALKGRGITEREIGKTAVGAVAGAIVGDQVDNKNGAVVGAIGGAAAGAAVADQTQDRDIVVATGNSITLELSGAFDG